MLHNTGLDSVMLINSQGLNEKVFFLSLYPVALKTLSHSLSLSNSYLKLVKNTKRKTPTTTKKQAHKNKTSTQRK